VGELVDLLPIILVAVVLWLSGLSYTFWRLLDHYRKLTQKANGGNLVNAIETLIKVEEKNSDELGKLQGKLASILKQGVLPIQKVGLVRFNPFDETGGDQSFSLCLLNGADSGFVLTALHTRDRTRVYTKPVDKGKSKYELSREEEKALKEAQK